jgi:hypothetical protein
MIMASKAYKQYYADGTSKLLSRSAKQGRKPSGLGKPKLIRLSAEDEEKLKILKEKLGMYWNENEFIRSAVSEKLSNSVYT